jgi:RecG-like helicase
VRVRLIGSVRKGSFAVRSHELDPQPAALVGIYSASEEITPKKIRELVTAALPHVTDYWDPLPAELRAREGLPLRSDALAAVHRPQTHAEAETGRRRLAFDELLLLQIGMRAAPPSGSEASRRGSASRAS